MRRNVLFIAKFNNILKGMNTLLAESFNMQMCPPEPTMVERMFDVLDVDLILLYISNLSDKSLTNLCDKFDVICKHTPIIVFGTAEECVDFDSYCTIAVSRYMHRPIAAHDIAKAIFETLDKAYEAPEDSAPDIPPEAPSAAPQPKISKGMSIVDLADSLEVEERRCILLVDDDGRILRAIKMLLENTYKINLANSGMRAIESIQRERPDAVLLDYEMPVLNGKQTLEIIRNNEKTANLPVFFLTGVADKERIKDVINLRPQGYILKSSEQSVILGTLEKFFNNLNK